MSNTVKRWIESYRLSRDSPDGVRLIIEDLREAARTSQDAATVLAIVEADQRRRRLRDDADLQAAFKRFDDQFFGGRLAVGTRVVFDPKLNGITTERGATKKDGSIVFVSPGDLDWEYVLIHEMVHAFEYRYPDEVEVSETGRSLAGPTLIKVLYQDHTELFFSKLLQVMAARGHGHDWLFLYYG